MKFLSGLKLLEERKGEARQAWKGDRIVYTTRIFLNQGDEVPLNDIQAKQVPKEMIRVVDGVAFIDHTIVPGQRQAIAGIEHALFGMKVGGYRNVRISPASGLSREGHSGLIPPDAVVTCEICLRAITQESTVRPQ